MSKVEMRKKSSEAVSEMTQVEDVESMRHREKVKSRRRWALPFVDQSLSTAAPSHQTQQLSDATQKKKSATTTFSKCSFTHLRISMPRGRKKELGVKFKEQDVLEM